VCFFRWRKKKNVPAALREHKSKMDEMQQEVWV
jgi:hypothetical protein